MTSIKNRKSDPKFVLAYERGMLRSAFVSLFWSVIQQRKKTSGFTLGSLAKAIGANKSEVSRWFRGDPNWTVNTIASLSYALNVDLEIKAIDKKTGTVFTPAGLAASVKVFAYSNFESVHISPQSDETLIPARDISSVDETQNTETRKVAPADFSGPFTVPDAQAA